MSESKYGGRYCMNCRHSVISDGAYFCMATRVYEDEESPIYGNYIRTRIPERCELARLETGQCGMEGRMYEDKGPKEKPKKWGTRGWWPLK